MPIRVKLFPRRIKLGDPVLGKRLEQFLFRHFHAGEERAEGLVVGRDGLRNVLQRGGKDVHGGEQVRGKALDGKVFGG